MTERRFALLILLLLSPAVTLAQSEDEEPYRTPLAGEPLETEVFGEKVSIPERDRGETLALSLGVTAFAPKVGDTGAVPFLALYGKKVWEERSLRAVLSGLVNRVDYSERLLDLGEAGDLRLLGHFDNSTIPFATTELVDGEELEFTSIEWGWNSVWVGGGYRLPIDPGNLDNYFSISAYYRASYYYFKDTDDTGKIDDVVVTAADQTPSDTYVHGLIFEVKADAMQRNILELPHVGVAGGMRAEWTRRDSWQDTGPVLPSGARQFSADDTRDYVKLTAHAVFAAPVPFLSERHRLIGQVHGGWMPNDDVDRFNAFRIGGGPPPSETDDLRRSPYPGAMFNQFLTQYYVIGSLAYRYEVFFWLYVQARVTLAYAKVPRLTNPVAPGPVELEVERGNAYSLGINSGFLWESTLYLEYTYDSGAVRAGDDGHTFLLVWSKAF